MIPNEAFFEFEIDKAKLIKLYEPGLFAIWIVIGFIPFSIAMILLDGSNPDNGVTEIYWAFFLIAMSVLPLFLIRLRLQHLFEDLSYKLFGDKLVILGTLFSIMDQWIAGKIINRNNKVIIPLGKIVGVETYQGFLGKRYGMKMILVRTANQTYGLIGVKEPDLTAEKIMQATIAAGASAGQQ